MTKKNFSADLAQSCAQAFLPGNFEAKGLDAMAAQERIINYHHRMLTIRTIAAYVTAVIFACIGAVLIVWAPEARNVAANLAAAAMLTLAAGIAGFSHFKAKAPGVDIQASSTPARSN